MIIGLKTYWIHIFITLLVLLLAHLLPPWIQSLMAFIMIFSVGIIHGANDLELIQKKTQEYSQLFYVKALLLYIVVVLLGVGLFFFLPALGLLFFLFFSAYHFGEQHLETKILPPCPRFLRFLTYIAYGTALFGLLFTLQWNEVHQIIYHISGQFVSKQTTEISFFCGMAVFVALGLNNTALRRWLLFEVLLILLFGWLFSRSSLLLGFGLYFVLWHSVPSMHDQLNFLYPNATNRGWKYIRASLPYWVLSLMGLVGVSLYFDIHSSAFLPLFFSFLAAITFPHTVVMGWLKWVAPNAPDS